MEPIPKNARYITIKDVPTIEMESIDPNKSYEVTVIEKRERKKLTHSTSMAPM